MRGTFATMLAALPCAAFRMTARAPGRAALTMSTSASFGTSNRFELEGSVSLVKELQAFESGFTKREFVLAVEDGPYTNEIQFQTVRAQTALLDGVRVGDAVRVAFNIRGNEWQ